MKVNGKELKMFYSIGAYARISDLCPNHSYSNLKALLAGNYAEAIINITITGRLLRGQPGRYFREGHAEGTGEPETGGVRCAGSCCRGRDE